MEIVQMEIVQMENVKDGVSKEWTTERGWRNWTIWPSVRDASPSRPSFVQLSLNIAYLGDPLQQGLEPISVALAVAIQEGKYGSSCCVSSSDP